MKILIISIVVLAIFFLIGLVGRLDRNAELMEEPSTGEYDYVPL